MPVSYNSQKIIPAPFARIGRVYNRAGDLKRLNAVFTVVLSGKLMAWKGSPDSSGIFHTTSGYPADEDILHDLRLAAIERKQEAIRRLFSNDGYWLEITPLDGSEPIKFLPRIKNIDFAEGLWYETCDYTIELECDRIYGGVFETDGDIGDNLAENVESASESWELTPNDEFTGEGDSRTFKLVHKISAKGKRIFLGDGRSMGKRPNLYY